MDGAREIYFANALIDSLDDCNLKDVECILHKYATVPNITLPGRGCTPFHLIIGHEDDSFAEKVTKMFIRVGGNPNTRNDDGMTPVHVAAAWGKMKLLHLLLLNGGDPSLLDEEGNSAFSYAFEYKHWDIVDMLFRFKLLDSNHIWTMSQPKYKINLDKIMVLNGDNVLEYAVGKSQNLVVNITETKDTSRALPDYCLSNMRICSEQSALSETSFFNLGPYSSNLTTFNSSSNIEHKTINQTNGANRNSANSLGKSSCRLSVVEKRSVKGLMNSRNLSVSNSSGLMEKNVSKGISQNLSKNDESDLSSYVHKTECAYTKPRIFLNQLSPPPAELLQNSILTSFREMELDDKCSQSIDCVSNINGKQFYNLKYSNFMLNEINDSRDMFESTRNSNIKVSNILKDSLNDGVYNTCTENSGNEQIFKLQQSAINKSSTSSNDTFVSVIEEYIYSDEENGVVLIEQRHLVNKISVPILNEDEVEITKSLSSATSVSSCMSVPLCLDYDSEALRDELRKSGVNPGPITTTTKRLYLKKLMKLNKQHQPVLIDAKTRVYRNELQQTLKNMDWLNKLDTFMKLEQEIATQFSNPDRSSRWRGGIAKTYFCYMLLDPRITLNLPCRRKDLSPLEVWSTFLSAIFYVGKGVRSRPYAHLNESSNVWKNKKEVTDDKVQHIIDIWAAGMGVVCLHVFQNVISVEAHTREAAMIEAVGLQNLKNARYSEYYGKAANWTCKQKAKLGVYLLYSALQIFLNEGERQLYPHHI